MDTRPVCFVIMPFSKTSRVHIQKYWTQHYDRFLRPLIEEDGALQAKRSEALRVNILHEIIRNLATAPIVVADLTDHNANVFWELGVRLSYKYGTVTIAQEGTKIPFDLGHKGTLFYDTTDYRAMEEFRGDFKASLRDCIARPDECDSPVMEALTERPGLFQVFRQDEVVRRLDGLVMECDSDLTTLRKVVAMAEANTRAPRNTRTMTVRKLTSHAIALFATERYADVPSPVYRDAYDLLQDIQGLNENLCLWTENTDPINEWLLRHSRSYIKHLEDFKESVNCLRISLVPSFGEREDTGTLE